MGRPDKNQDMADIAEEVKRTTDDTTQMQSAAPDERTHTDMQPTGRDERTHTEMQPPANEPGT